MINLTFFSQSLKDVAMVTDFWHTPPSLCVRAFHNWNMKVRVNTSTSNKNSLNFDLVTCLSFAGAFVPGGPQAGFSHAFLVWKCFFFWKWSSLAKIKNVKKRERRYASEKRQSVLCVYGGGWGASAAVHVSIHRAAERIVRGWLRWRRQRTDQDAQSVRLHVRPRIRAHVARCRGHAHLHAGRHLPGRQSQGKGHSTLPRWVRL